MTVATASTTPAEPGVVAALTVAEGVEFDSVLAGVDVACSLSGVGVGGVFASVDSAGSTEAAGSPDSGWISTTLVSSSGSALVDGRATDASDSEVLVCAPPLLPMVTPDATSVDDDVAPDAVAVPVVDVVPLPVDVDPPLVDVESAPVVVDEVAVPAESVDDSPDVVLDVELVADDSEDVPVVSAAAVP